MNSCCICESFDASIDKMHRQSVGSVMGILSTEPKPVVLHNKLPYYYTSASIVRNYDIEERTQETETVGDPDCVRRKECT